MSFTFTDNGTGIIAMITSKGKPPTFVYLCKEEAERESSIVDEKLDPSSINHITRALASGMSLREAYKLVGGQSRKSGCVSEIKLGEGEAILPYPSGEFFIYFIAGESGCGKSTIVANICKIYQIQHPNNTIWMFLRQEDPAYKEIPHQEVSFTPPENADEEELVQWSEDIEDVTKGRIQLDKLSDSLVVFDDCDGLQDKKLSLAVNKLMADCAMNGRKRGISTIYVSHLLKDREKTRVILFEAHRVWFFPGCGSTQIESFLRDYCGMKKKEAEALANMKSRWVMLNKRPPRYVIHEKGAFML